MALTRTTLSSAVAVGDTSVVVASATGFAVGRTFRIDDEWFVVRQSYDGSSTTIPANGGQNGSLRAAHVASAGVVVGTADDWDSPSAAVPVPSPLAGRTRRVLSITATSTLTLPPAGQDTTVILNGTSVITLTIPVPTTDMDGDELNIIGNGAAAHVLTFTGGLSGAGAGYTTVTCNATKPIPTKFVACNGVWGAYAQTPLAGTVTNITGTVA